MTTIYTLVLLKNLGADPNDPEVREAISRVKTRLTWRPLDNRPYFDGETEPCINAQSWQPEPISARRAITWSTCSYASSSRMAAGPARLRLARALRSIPPSVFWKGCWNTRRLAGPRHPP
jgi:hypothetical protein